MLMMLLLVLNAQPVNIYLKRNANLLVLMDTTKTILLDGVRNADVIVKLVQVMMSVLLA